MSVQNRKIKAISTVLQCKKYPEESRNVLIQLSSMTKNRLRYSLRRFQSKSQNIVTQNLKSKRDSKIYQKDCKQRWEHIDNRPIINMHFERKRSQSTTLTFPA